jgi:type IV secretion system protein VirB8
MKKTHYEEALDWEASRTHLMEKSERRAWRIAGCAAALVVLALAAIVLMMPLKQTIPFVIRVDNVTGVPDIVTTLKEGKVTYDEIMDKYWVAGYVRARETYDRYTLQKDYDTVGLLSSPTVGADYAQLFQGPNALDKTFGSNVRALVEIVSVVPNGKGNATVRFRKRTERVNQKSEGEVRTYVATLAYEYRDAQSMRESLRLVNPLGFQVTSYRVDPELIGDKK